MISKLGNICLFLGLITSIILIFFSITNIKNNIKKFPNRVTTFLILQFLIVVTTFFTLVYAFVVSDFSVETVYNHSHTAKPIFYKLSGVWGNHEGSLILWLLVLSLFIFIFTIFSKKLNKLYRLLTIVFQELIILGFFLFIITTSNPFDLLYPTPKEGLGLNPILQDPALAIHPPILYVGYVGTSIIFSSSMSALISKNINSQWASHIKIWIFISWIFLTIGILLGSIWAYYELGWGGFWFWDPVENVSLMPWFCLTALLHSITVLEKRLSLKNWTIILSIATFSFSMSGTFLVRSGILNSVHTFANDPSRGIFILVFLFLLIFLALIIFFIYSKNDTQTGKFYWLSKETAILFNNWFMMYFLSVILIGTTYPIFLEVITNEKISIGPPFYQKLIIPFLIPFILLMIFGPKLMWIKDKFKRVNILKILFLLISILISYIIVVKTSINYLFLTILLVFSFFLIFVSVKDLFEKKNKLSQKISHFAFSLFLLSILLNSIFAKEISTNMKIGDEIIFMDKSIKFESLETFKKSNYNSLKAKFQIFEKNNKTLILYPEIRIYDQPSILTSEADIKINLLSDNFIVFNLLKDDGYFNVRYQYKPLMLWIWISVLLMVLGGILSLRKA